MAKKSTRRIRYLARIYKIMIFFIALFLGTLVSLMIPLRPTHSETEKRELAKFPRLSLAAFVDGSYFGELDAWYSDTFPFRDTLLAGNTLLSEMGGIQTVEIRGSLEKMDEIPTAPAADLATGEEGASSLTTERSQSEMAANRPDSGESGASAQPVVQESQEPEDVSNIPTQTMGPIFIAGDSVYEYYGFSRETADRYIGMINSITGQLAGKATVYDMLVPNSMDVVLQDSIRKELNSSNQKDAMKYMYDSMRKETVTVPVYDTLRDHRKEYVYFRTDHHWTALGAYYAYAQFAARKGITPNKLESYQLMEFPGFLGTFYAESGKLAALENNPDTVAAYIPRGTNDITIETIEGGQRAWNIVSDVTGWADNSKYNAFIGGDNPLSVIENPALTDGSACVVVKESYGNALVPFLVDHYQTVYVIDYRYYRGKLASFVEEHKIQDVLFVNNMVAAGTGDRVAEMERLVN